jgi:hypothetical protein
MNPWRTPERILCRELANEDAHVLRYARTSGVASALPGPKQAKAAAVPCDDRFGLHQVKRRAPATPHVQQRRPQHPVRRGETQTRPARSMDDRQLMPEGEDLQVEGRT